MIRGPKTESLAKKLEEQIQDYEVYHDHGESGERLTVYFGGLASSSRVSYVDIVIVDPKTREVTLMCEVEEREKAPKGVLGDLFSFLLAEKVRIMGTDYHINDTFFVIGLKIKERGKKAVQVKKIKEKLSEVIKPEIGDRIEIITAGELDELVDVLRREILEMV